VFVMKPNELMHYMGDMEIDAADFLWLGKEAPLPTEQGDQSGIVTLSWTRWANHIPQGHSYSVQWVSSSEIL
jgi:hypothetical protein